MSRRIVARYLVAVLFLLGVALPMTGVARAGTTSNAPPAAIAELSTHPGEPMGAAGDGTRPHFGYSRASVLAQSTAIGLAGLQQLPNIPIGAWSTFGGVAPNAPSFDIQSFDFVRGIIYIAVRNVTSATVGNSGPGLVAINTATNTVVGTLQVPDCNAVNTQRASFQCPSGVSVLNDLRKVVVTSRGEAGQNFVEIFDISADPVNAPMLARINLPNNQLEPDELDYDPANHRVYVANTNGTFFQAVIDGVTNTLVGQIPVTQFCPTTMEQARFSPADGFIYQTCSADSILLRTDPAAGAFGAVVGVWTTPCTANGIDIDPFTNQALLGCNPGGQAVVNLNTPSTLAVPRPPIPLVASFPQVNATDSLYFDNNTLRWYTGSSGNTNTGVDSCPASQVNAAQRPVLGVFQGALTTVTPPTIVGVQCTANGAHTVGVDTIRNQIYVPAGVPVNAVMVFKDNTAPQTTPAASVTFGNNGGVSFTPNGAGATVQGTLTGVPVGTTIQLVVVTTVGNEVVTCTRNGATVTCAGTLVGKPISGAPVLLTSNGVIIATGTAATGALPVSTLTSGQAIAQAQGTPGFVSGTTGVACATQVGQTCQGTGNGLNAVGTVTGSMRWTINATLPAAPAAGAGTPIFVVTTTAGVEGVPCTPAPAVAPAAGTVVTCTANTVGNALQGAAAVLVFPGVGAAAGPVVGPAIITGPGAPAVVVPVVPPAAPAVLPHLPPPPPLLPPPPPLLPPPPFTMGSGMMPMPEVPVIPEADTLPLILGGLVGLGALAGWRARRRS